MSSDWFKPYHKLPSTPCIWKPATSLENKTGGWRTFKPILDLGKCTKCLICWIYCPDGCIKRGVEEISINYDYCKGCGLCASECPVKAIAMVREVF